jgi:hypothetical protein
MMAEQKNAIWLSNNLARWSSKKMHDGRAKTGKMVEQKTV